jgi:hypothetical protein
MTRSTNRIRWFFFVLTFALKRLNDLLDLRIRRQLVVIFVRLAFSTIFIVLAIFFGSLLDMAKIMIIALGFSRFGSLHRTFHFGRRNVHSSELFNLDKLPLWKVFRRTCRFEKYLAPCSVKLYHDQKNVESL